MSETGKTDILVLGGGPGGYTAAFRAADLLGDSGTVTIVDRGPTLGGVCLNIGCIPSKSLLFVAETIVHAKEAAKYGLQFGPPVIDLAKVRAHRDSVVGTLTKGLDFLARRRKVRVVYGEGSFLSPTTMSVKGKDGEAPAILEFGSCIVAAGSRPVEIPGFPHSDPRVWSSTDALRLDSIPAKLFILGGGIIGLEMATVYSAFGSEITIVEMMDHVIPPADADAAEVLQRLYKRSGWKVHVGTRVESMRATPEGIAVSFGGKESVYDAALVSVGRKPNSDRIGAQAAGLALDAAGRIIVDDRMRTSTPGIFAIGDIVPGPQLAHKATHEAKVAAEVALGHPSAFIAKVIPSVAYTSPEVAWVGLTEKEAKEKNIEVKVGSFPWKASGRSLSQGNLSGFTKAIFDASDDRLVGAAMVGPHAGELIAEAALAIEMGADMHDIGKTIHPHPTLSETLGLAAEMVEGTITDL